MSHDNAIREKPPEAIESQKLPDRPPDRVWAGPGTGQPCVLCADPIGRSEIELEIEFSVGNGPEPSVFFVHAKCMSSLESKRKDRSRSLEVVSVSSRMHHGNGTPR